jgi:hypothetical protein
MDVGQFSETGAYAVDDAALGDNFLDHSAGGMDSRVRRGPDLDGVARIGDVRNLRERQGLAGQFHATHLMNPAPKRKRWRKKGQVDETTWPFMVKAIRRRTS